MKFRTEYVARRVDITLDPTLPVLLTGSCFSDYIGKMMQESGWPAVSNPCGTLYNPASLALAYQLALTHRVQRREIVRQSITTREGRFVSWFMGAVASGATEEECIDTVCERLDTLEEAIEKSESIIVTFGTADVWLLKGTDCAVGNCHKHPAAEFSRQRLGIAEIAEAWSRIIAAIRLRNTEVKFIFTVSPRRYLSDGFEDNSRLKAILLLACEQICLANEKTYYFPAYEILTDDLRDYRFYGSDLLHPSPVAVEYIWQKFCDTFIGFTPRRLPQGGHRPILP